MDHAHHDEGPPSFWRSRLGIGWVVLAAVAGWFLWTEHRAHLLGFLPYLFLLACPLMHVFMHQGSRTFITFSAGVTEVRDADTLNSAIARADEAMYRAKRDGKNCVRSA